MSKAKPTKAEIDAASKVYKKLSWLSDYASKDEIISALRHLANRLQLQLDRERSKRVNK